MKVIIGHDEYDSKDHCIGIKFNPAEVVEFLENLKKAQPVIKIKSDMYKDMGSKFPTLFNKLKGQSKYATRIKKTVNAFIEVQVEKLVREPAPIQPPQEEIVDY